MELRQLGRVFVQPVNQRFRWQAEPASNNSSSPSGKLNLLYELGSTTPTETGLSISNAGALTVPGVTLPALGTASGTNTAGFNSWPLDLLASAWNTSGTPQLPRNGGFLFTCLALLEDAPQF